MFRHSLVFTALLGLTSTGLAGTEEFFEKRVHDFGATPKGPTLVHYFRFTNNGKDTLTISNVRVSCGCVSAAAAATQVKPGESSHIAAHMDSRRFSGHKAVTIYVQFSSPRFEEITLQVQANGRDDFTMYPETMAVGTIRKGSEAKGSIQVTLTGDPNWNITEAKADSNYVKPEAKLVKRSNTEVTFEISATLRNDLPVGKWYTDIWLTTSNASVAKVRVPLTVEVGGAVTITPGSVSLGDIKIGDTAEQNVLVKSDKPFKIKSIQGTDNLVSVTGMSDDAKAVHILKIVVKPTAAGDISRDLTVVSEDDKEQPATIPVRAVAVKE